MPAQRLALYRPLPVDASRFPFIAHVLSFFPMAQGVGSGTLIGPRVILTAGHVVYDYNKGGYATTWRVTVGGQNGQVFETAIGRTTTQWVQNDCRVREANGLSAFDFGTVVLPEPIDALITPLSVETIEGEVLRNRMLSVAGYAAAHYPQIRLYGTKSAASHVGTSRIACPIATFPGMSGGPVYDIVAAKSDQTPRRTLRAIHTSFVSGQANALRIGSNCLKLIRQWLDEFAPPSVSRLAKRSMI